MIYVATLIVILLIIIFLLWLDLRDAKKSAEQIARSQAHTIYVVKQERDDAERRCLAWKQSYEYAANEALKYRSREKR